MYGLGMRIANIQELNHGQTHRVHLVKKQLIEFCISSTDEGRVVCITV